MLNMAVDKQVLYYAMQNSEQVPIYETDAEGNVIYDEIDGEQVPRETGNWRVTYQAPVKFYGNINSGNVGETVARAYGVSTGDFEAVLCMRKGELPINERSLIWYKNEPSYLQDGSVDPKSADYRVKRVPPCLNEIIYLLGKLDNNDET